MGIEDEIIKDVERAAGIAATKIRRRLHDRINSYYNGYDPGYYKRTENLYSALYSEHNGTNIRVGLDSERMNEYDHENLTMYRPGRDPWNEAMATFDADMVLDIAVHGHHPQGKNKGYEKTHAIWDYGVNGIDNKSYIDKVVKTSLKEAGIPVK